ncbi:MAG: hypothetical protein RIQ93_676 [Verrucomicrobiota bacterium]|jgi:hypothetical protein
MNSLLPSRLSVVFVVLVTLTAPLGAAPLRIFDGQSLTGWEGDSQWWRVSNGIIVGGSLTEKVPKNVFLATRQTYQNFDLRLWIKVTGAPGAGFVNSGIQFRSIRMAGSTEMIGYQADAGEGWWGKLYDESRRKKVIAEPANAAAVAGAVRKNDWNEYRIRAEGPHIQTWVNGVLAVDFKETERNIPQEGLIGLQTHSGGPVLVQIKDIMIEELPPTAGAPTWQSGPQSTAKSARPSSPVKP